MFTKKYLTYGFVLCLSILFIGSPSKQICAQKKKPETINNFTKEKHSPHKATIYSMLIPGWGQAYNKKYWKIPIVYAGFGVMIYFIAENGSQYKKFKAAYNYVEAGNLDLPPPNDYTEKYNASQLEIVRDVYRRNLDYSYIITGLWYLLNVVDASVDAHLFEFEVSDDLTLRIEPDIKFLPRESEAYTGLKISFKLPISKH